MKKLLFTLLIMTGSAFSAQVIGISDGDTLTVIDNNKPLKIRLANIDAPEKKQAWGERSKQSLSELCFGKDAQYVTQTIDRYKRTVAVVTCDGVQVNRAQVERGLAWSYTRYSKDASLPAIEAEARDNKIGLWADNEPVAPWEFRQGK